MSRNYEHSEDEWELSGGEESEDDYDDDFNEPLFEVNHNLCLDNVQTKKSAGKRKSTAKGSCAKKLKVSRKASSMAGSKLSRNAGKIKTTAKKMKVTRKAAGVEKTKLSRKPVGTKKTKSSKKVPENGWRANNTEWKSVPDFDSVEIASTFEHDNKSLPVFYFKKFLSEDVWQLIVDETNRYAIQENSKNWTEVTIQEMKAFLGMIVLMGVNNLPVIDLYWSSNPLFYNPVIAGVMTCKRFKKILENLHLNDNSEMPKRGEAGFDRLYKIRPFLNLLGRNFSASAKSTKSQSIDESMILFTGRSFMKQRMPNKPKIRVGYKVWSRCDSQTGYFYEFEIYTGKRDDKVVEKGLGASVVKRLCASLEGSDTHVAFDNYFTTVDLMPDLCQKNIYSTSTVRSDRVGLPEEAKQNNKMARGEFIWKVKDDLGFVQWMDTKQVNVLSTAFHPSIVSKTTRTQKDGKKIEIPCPVVITEYSKRMGGVDRFDQKRISYTVGRRSKRWWLRIFYFFVDAALVNAFVLYSSIPRSKNRQLTHLNFQVAVGNQLIGKFCSRKDIEKLPSANLKRARAITKDYGITDDIRLNNVGIHMPMELPKSRRCRLCSSKLNNKRSKIECSECKVPLCVKSCFANFHCY